MEKTTIYFIRHGEIDNLQRVFYGRSLDLHLNEEGKRQIHTIAERIKSTGANLDSIYTSPLSRALESANIFVSVFTRASIFKDDDLVDVDIPALIGHSITERDEIHTQGVDEYRGEFVEKGNESCENITERMSRAFKKIFEDNIGKTVVIISHGDPLRFLLFHLQDPDKPLPLMGELIRSYYPGKGEGWKMVFDESGRVLETEFITKEGNMKGEREY